MDTVELQQVIVNQAVQIDKLTRKVETYRKSNQSMAESKLKDLIRIEVLDELLLSTCEENVYVTAEDRAHHNEAIDATVEQRLREHYELNHGED